MSYGFCCNRAVYSSVETSAPFPPRAAGHQKDDRPMKRSASRNLLSLLIILFVLWQVWQRVHIVFWVNVPWWGLALLVIGVIVLLDVALDQLLGKGRP